jgi:hypothetical protein
MWYEYVNLSPRANYIDWATAACRRSDCQLLRIEGATWSAWRILTAVFSVFYTGAAAFLSSSSSVVLTTLSEPRSRPTSSPTSPICTLCFVLRAAYSSHLGLGGHHFQFISSCHIKDIHDISVWQWLWQFITKVIAAILSK